MEPTRELANQIDRDRWEAASAMTFEQRAMAGVSMFDVVVEAMRAGIRLQYPRFSPNEVEHELLQRLRDARRNEEAA